MHFSIDKITSSLAFGAVAITSGILLNMVFPEIVKIKITEFLTLDNDSEIFNYWVEPPVPIEFRVYLFNVTNSEEVSSNNSKPILQQVGPFIFREHRRKEKIKFNDEEDTVSYVEKKWYTPLPEKSNGSFTQNVTTLNALYAILAQKTHGMDIMVKMVFQQIVRTFNPTLFITKPVEELLFKGYEDQLLNQLQKLSGEIKYPEGKFGLLYAQNNSAHNFSVFTGKKNRSKFMNIFKYNNNTHVKGWSDSYCNMINGSDGTFFQPFIKPEDKIYAFLPEFCRSGQLRYKQTQTVNGLPIYRYVLDSSVYASPYVQHENKCFCPKSTKCLDSKALFYVGNCLENTPIVASFPHFYMGDDAIYNATTGLNRNENLHEFYLDIEPTTGILYKAKLRGQVNIALKSVSHIQSLKNISEILFPIMWMELHMELPSEVAEKLWLRITLPQRVINTLMFMLISSGTLCFLIGLYCIAKNPKSWPTQNSSSNTSKW